ncbi:MAG: GNAT family N-acetyltransferase [Oscillospiraceae bacterium]|jgi:GNAT superfamily N-acetyltransferase|nr:GNAT family N-acetyltransferase [Oscillospiraceae bacterium]
MIEIKRLTEATLPLLGRVEDRRLDSERVVVRSKQGGLDLSYQPMPGALWRMGGAHTPPHDGAQWLASPDRAAYLAWLDGALAGEMLLEAAEYGLARVSDLRVDLAMRRMGVGAALIALAEDWARGRGLNGITAETQDVNAGACQFFTKCGFALGGVDTLRYVAASPQTLRVAGLRESALFFYKFIK